MERESITEGRKSLSGDAPTTIKDVDDEQLDSQDVTNTFPVVEETDSVHKRAKIQTMPMNNDEQTTSSDLKGNPPAKDLVSCFRIIFIIFYCSPFRTKVPCMNGVRSNPVRKLAVTCS